MSNLSQQLFQAIDEIVSAKLNQVTFDKTVVCTVIEQVAEDPTLYWVNEGSVKFTARAAIASEKYHENQKVYVTIPNGDYNLDKIIIGGYLAEKLPEYLYTDPFKKLAPAATIKPSSAISLIATVGASNATASYTLPNTFQLIKPALGNFDYVGIKYSFDTQSLTEYQGNYALRIEFINGDNSYPVTLYSAQMAGNPYTLDGRIFYNHLLPCPAGMPDGEYTITASLVLNNDFAEEDNGKTITCQVYALYLGYNVSAIEGKQELKIQLGEGESLEYKEANEIRVLNATWLTDNNIYYIDNPHPERKSIFHPEYSVRWFRHRPGIEESKAQGWPVDKGWELLMYEGQGGVLKPYTYQIPNYALSTDRATDVLKAYVFVKNYKEDGNASKLDLKIYYNLETIKGWITDLKGALDSENIEVPTLIETLNQTVISSELFEKGEAYLNQFNVEETNTNHAIFQEIKSFTWYTCLSSLISNIKQDININTEAISDTENNLVRSARNKINLRCDIALDTLEREGKPQIHLTSNELVFSNTATTATTNPEDEQATIIIDSSEGTTLNIYSVSSGDLLEDKLVTLTPRLSAAALEKGYNVSLRQGDVIKWTVPSTGTLIRELSVAGTNSSTPFEHTQTVGVNTEYSKYPLQIRFKSKYSSAATDNVVTCEVIRNGMTVVRGELNLIVGTTGTNGTQYSLNLEIISDNKYVVGPRNNDKVRPIRIEAVLRNTNGEKVTINPSNIEWKWFTKSYDLDFETPKEIEQFYAKLANKSSPIVEYSLADLVGNQNTATPNLKGDAGFMPIGQINSTCIDLIYNPLDVSSYQGNYFHRAWGYWELTNTSILQCTIKGFEISAENSTKTVNLTQLLPIACGDEWFYDEKVQQPYDGPGTIVYDSGGNNAESTSSTFKQAYSQYWEVLSPPEFKAFAPIITSETKTTNGKTETIFNLCPAPFIPAATIPAVACAKSDKDADGKLNYMYQQPILIYRNNYAIDLINNWSGALTIDNEQNAILAATMVAGSLDSSNKFTGAMIGKVRFGDKDYEGLLGMKQGNRTFSLDVKGNFFVGDLLGQRYISFDDNGLDIKTNKLLIDVKPNDGQEGNLFYINSTPNDTGYYDSWIAAAYGTKANGKPDWKFYIRKDGNAYFSGDIYANSLILGESAKATIEGLIPSSEGFVKVNTRYGDNFYFEEDNGLLTAHNAYISGRIVANEGNVGGLEILNKKIYSANYWQNNNNNKDWSSYTAGMNPQFAHATGNNIFLWAGANNTLSSEEKIIEWNKIFGAENWNPTSGTLPEGQEHGSGARASILDTANFYVTYDGEIHSRAGVIAGWNFDTNIFGKIGTIGGSAENWEAKGIAFDFNSVGTDKAVFAIGNMKCYEKNKPGDTITFLNKSTWKNVSSFYVTGNGKLFASNAEITGTLKTGTIIGSGDTKIQYSSAWGSYGIYNGNFGIGVSSTAVKIGYTDLNRPYISLDNNDITIGSTYYTDDNGYAVTINIHGKLYVNGKLIA